MIVLRPGSNVSTRVLNSGPNISVINGFKNSTTCLRTLENAAESFGVLFSNSVANNSINWIAIVAIIPTKLGSACNKPTSNCSISSTAV